MKSVVLYEKCFSSFTFIRTNKCLINANLTNDIMHVCCVDSVSSKCFKDSALCILIIFHVVVCRFSVFVM